MSSPNAPPPPPPLNFRAFAAYGKRAARYGAVTALVLALGYLLHYAGNQLPFEVAQQRFAATFDSAGRMSQTGVPFAAGRNRSPTHEYCTLAAMVFTGAADRGNALVNAALPTHPDENQFLNDPIFCGVLKAAAPEDIRWGRAKFRYRWGGKAVFASALHFVEVAQFHQFIKIATYAAYLLLACALLTIGWRALAVVSPFLLLAPFFSGIPPYAEAVNGIPHLWAALAAALLAVALANPNWARHAPLGCFVAGAVSVYLWMFDGHNFYAFALIGVVAWVGYAHIDTREQTRAAAVCAGLYIAGFISLFALDQLVKGALVQWLVAAGNTDYTRVAYENFGDKGGVLNNLRAVVEYRFEQLTGTGQRGTDSERARRYYARESVAAFFPYLATAGGSFAKALLAAGALAWAGAIALAWRQSQRGKHDLLHCVLFFALLALAFSVHFLLPDDLYPRGARYHFTPLALGFSCLFYALSYRHTAQRETSRRKRRRGHRARR